MQRFERAKLLGNRERRVVRQHDPTRAEADRPGLRGDVSDEHTGGRRRDRGHVVVLGVPDPPITPLLRVLGECHAGGEAVAG